MKDSLFRKEQQKKLWQMISDTLHEIAEPKETFWVNRMYRHYARRFYYLTKCEWVPFLGQFNDSQAYGHYKNFKSRRYCMLIRDYAARLQRELQATENERMDYL